MSHKPPGKPACATTQQKTILLVDDEPAVRQMVGRVLELEGYRVLLAANGPDAIRIASSNPVQLVLLDLNMPGQSGWDTFEKLTSKNPLLTVVIITARPDQLFTAVGAGVGALLEKPLNFQTLLTTVGNLLEDPPSVRLARLAGKQTDFHYFPSETSRMP